VAMLALGAAAMPVLPLAMFPQSNRVFHAV
jgi:hypothetical protein